MSKIKKAVIPVAGLGTRFLPATKAIPKEMLPIVDIPNILHVVQEAVDAGIEDIIFVTGRHKTSLEEFFDHNYELEDTLAKQGKTDLLKIAQNISEMANIVSVRQKQPLGLGHAIYCAKPAVGNNPFAVLLGDEVMRGSPTVTGQLAEGFSDSDLSCVAIMEVPQEDTKKYGIAAVEKTDSPHLFNITKLVEKPQPDKAPSRWALPGRYVFTPQLFDFLEKAKPTRGGEIQLTDAMDEMIQSHGILGCAFTGERFDTGDKLGFVCANIEFALSHPQIGQDIKKYILSLAQRLQNEDK